MKRNLASPANLLSIMSSNSKENIDTLSQIFNSYFLEKSLPNRIAIVLGRKDINKIVQVKLYDVKFIYTMYVRNWNRSYYSFLGCYCQRGDSFKQNY